MRGGKEKHFWGFFGDGGLLWVLGGIMDWWYVFVADLEALSCQVTRKFIRS